MPKTATKVSHLLSPEMELREIGAVGVDSGQVMVGDPCYLSDWKDDNFTGKEDKAQPYDFSYSGACNATLSDERGGELGRGLAVASSTNYGDGCYPVFQVRDGDEIVGLFIQFGPEIDEDDYEDEDDEF